MNAGQARTQTWIWRVFVAGCSLSSALLLGSCSTAKPKILEQERVAQVEVGKSTKEDVVHLLGLPHRREVSDSDSGETREYWVYFKGRGMTEITLIIPVGAASLGGGVTMSAFLAPRLSQKEMENVGAVIVFDDHGQVIDATSGGQEK